MQPIQKAAQSALSRLFRRPALPKLTDFQEGRIDPRDGERFLDESDPTFQAAFPNLAAHNAKKGLFSRPQPQYTPEESERARNAYFGLTPERIQSAFVTPQTAPAAFPGRAPAVPTTAPAPRYAGAQSALSRLFRRRTPSAPAAQPAFIPAPLDADGLPNLEPDTATFQTAYPNISQGLGAARPNNAPTGGAQELARERYWQNALSAPAQAAAAAAAPKLPAVAAPAMAAVRKPVSAPAPIRQGAPARLAVAVAQVPAKSTASAPLVKRYKPVGSTGTSVISGMYAADAPGTYASLDEAKASYKKPTTPPVAAAPSSQGSAPMKKTAADQLNRLGAQLKTAQMAPVPRYTGAMAAPTDRPVDVRPYADYASRPSASHEDADIVSEFDTPNGAPSLLSQLRQGATGLGIDVRGAAGRATEAMRANPSVTGGAVAGAVAGAGFNALRTAVSNIRRKKKGEPTKSVLGGALTGGLVGGGLGAGAGYAMKQAEAVGQLNWLGVQLKQAATIAADSPTGYLAGAMHDVGKHIPGIPRILRGVEIGSRSVRDDVVPALRSAAGTLRNSVNAAVPKQPVPPMRIDLPKPKSALPVKSAQTR